MLEILDFRYTPTFYIVLSWYYVSSNYGLTVQESLWTIKHVCYY